MATLPERYQQICTELKVKANSAVKQQLPETAEGFTSWNLSGNIVGTKGVVAILKLTNEMPELETLNLSGNNIGSAATKDILAHLVNHPTVESIDLSNNDIRLGGPELVELLKKNKKIRSMNVDNTHLRPLFTRLISIQIIKNGGGEKAKKSTRFTFGEPGEDAAEEHPEDNGFAAFGEEGNSHVHWDPSSQKGKGGTVPRRPTVCAEVFREDEIDKFVPDVIEKDPKTKQWLMNVLERHDLFSHLEDYELMVAVDAMSEVNRVKGDTIFDEEDEEEGDLFYVIGNGEVEHSVKGEVINTLKKGDTSQDLLLMYSQPYHGTGVCKVDTTIYTLDRTTYKCVLSKASKKKRAMYEEFLKGIGFLKNLSHIELLQLADALKPANFEDGQALIRYGEVGETFFIIVEGTVDVWGRGDDDQEKYVCSFTRGENIGELEFLNNHKCVADVRAKGFVRTAKMNRHHFEMVMGPAKELLKKVADESEVYTYYRETLEKMEKKDKDEHHDE
jgi:CRP-like cAMP-binding protein